MSRLISVSFLSAVTALSIASCTAQMPDEPSPAPTYSNPTVAPVATQPPRVLVFPFRATGAVGTYDWIGRGIQQSLLADLSSTRSAQVIFPATQPKQGPVDPIAIASQSQANLVIIGSYQVNENQVRVTGEVFDVPGAKNIGGLKATGPVSDLFKLEDALRDQLMQMLPNASSVAPPAVGAPEVIRPQSVDSSTPVYVQSAPAATYVYQYPDDYSYPYSYPYYAYPTVGYFGIYGGGFFHRGGFHRGFDHGHFGGRPFVGRSFGGTDFRHGGSIGGFRGGGSMGGFHGGGSIGGFHGGVIGGFHGGGGGFAGHR